MAPIAAARSPVRSHAPAETHAAPRAAEPARSSASTSTSTPHADPTGRHVDAFEASGSRAKQDVGGAAAPEAATPPAEARTLSRLERRPEVAALPEATRARIHTLEEAGSPAADRNLTDIVTARGFGRLSEARQATLLDAFERHPESDRVTRGLTHLASNRAFREADDATAATSVTDACIPRNLRSDALRVMNTTEPEHITVHGVPIDVYGATPSELETITNTLDRLPPSHLRTIPRVVVSENIGHGNNDTGGGWMPESAIRHYESENPANTEMYRAEGWVNEPRLELTRESLTEVESTHLSNTLLHETGHAVDERYGLSGDVAPDDLGNVVYNGGHTEPDADARGPVSERFADAYMSYYWNREGLARRDPTAYRTIDEHLARVPPD